VSILYAFTYVRTSCAHIRNYLTRFTQPFIYYYYSYLYYCPLLRNLFLHHLRQIFEVFKQLVEGSHLLYL